MRSLYILAILVAALFIWAYATHVDIAARAQGLVRPSSELVKVMTESGGRIEAFAPREGLVVQHGDVLLSLDATALRLREQALLSTIHYSELRLTDLDTIYSAEARSSEAALTEARTRHDRMLELFKLGLISQVAFEEARSTLEGAERTADLSRNRVTDSAQRTPLVAAIAANYKELDQLRLEITRLDVTAPVSGRITSAAPFHTGEVIGPGIPIATILPTFEPLVIESWVTTPRIEPGQTVRIRDDDVHFVGSIAAVSPDVRQDGARRIVVKTDAPLELGRSYELHFVTRTERLLMLPFNRIRREFQKIF